MFKNYITVAIRNLKRQKLYAFINIFGLALGIACCILMTLFVKHEWSHDRFHQNGENLFRLVTHQIRPSGEINYDVLFTHQTVDQLKDEIPGIAKTTTFMRSGGRITFGDQTFRERTGLVSPDFLTMFTFPLLAGDPETALDKPNGIVISTNVARKFFGESDAQYSNVLGQTLTFPGQDLTFSITGVLAPIPDVSSLQFQVLIPVVHWKKFGRTQTNDSYASIYVLLNNNQNADQVEMTLHPFAQKHLEKRIRDLRAWRNIQTQDNAFALWLQPLTDVYWNAKVATHYENNGNLTTVYILWGIAGLVLLIACSNFTTLSISGSIERAMEIGVRKVLGANRRQVMQQFWSEALLLSFFGLLLGIALAEVFLPPFNSLVQSNLQISYFVDASFLALLLFIVTIVGLFSGSYPALVISRFQPVASIKGEMRLGGRSWLTRLLVVLQYAASIALIACTGILIEQQRYMQNKNLGYDQEHIVVVTSEDEKIAERYKQEVLKETRVLNATITDRAFTTGSASTGYKLPDGTRFSTRLIYIDADFLSTLNIALVSGQNFTDTHPSALHKSVLINEAMAKRLGQKNLIGQTISGLSWSNLKDATIIGIVRDFHIDSMHRAIQPLVLHRTVKNSRLKVLIRIHPDNLIGTVAILKEIWKNIAPPDEQIQLSFLDNNLDRQYRNEQRWQRILTYSACFAIAISCLGLLGLASLAVSRRTKEIGIRKVLGASVPNLVNLLTLDFIKLLLIANVIAWPIAYYTMDKWLTNFAYHIELGIGIFALSGALALAVALLTVGTQTFKAARSNPVDALRYE